VAAAWEAEVQERDDGNGATPPPRFAWAPSPDAAYGDALGGGYLELVGADGRAGVPLADGGGGDGSDGSEGGGQDGGGEAEAEVDPAALLPPPRSSSSSSSSPRLEAHAAFWPSYRSPALFLRGRWPDGGLMGLGDLEAALFPPAAPDPGTPSSPPPSSSTAPPPLAPADHQHAGAGGGWAVLHPCHTTHVMGRLAGASAAALSAPSHVAAWLSLAGPVVGLAVPAGLGAAVVARTQEGALLRRERETVG